MSARRRSMTGVEDAGTAPRVLSEGGVSDALWGDWDAVVAWCKRRSLPVPLEAYRDAPRALRDHCAYSWMVRSGYVNKWGQPDWSRAGALGVLGCGGARSRARLAAWNRGVV